MGQLIFNSIMSSQTNMLICVVLILAILDVDAVSHPDIISEAAPETEKFHAEVDFTDTQVQENDEDLKEETNENNFGIFLNEAELLNTPEQRRITNMTFSDSQLTELSRASRRRNPHRRTSRRPALSRPVSNRRAGSDKMNISCAEPHMFIKGSNLIFSQIKRSISTGSVHDSCRKLLNTDRLKYMNIFALNTILIDEDIQQSMNLTIIAPKWKINGKRRIQLDGEDGKLQNTKAPAYGKNGKPGEPGKPGSNFFGIGEEFIGGEDLTISVSGGSGSRGQKGGKGEKGKNGTSPTVPSNFPCDKGLCDDGKKINHLKCQQIECIKDTWSSVVDAFVIISAINSAINKKYCSTMVRATGWTYKIYGDPGSPGKNGGNGGKGGKGGYPGEIAFFELKGPSRVTQIKNFGSEGLDGKGGKGGVGGKKGDVMNLKCDANEDKWSMVSKIVSTEIAASGKNGIDGKNTKNMQKPTAAIHLSKLDKAKTINQYKSFLRENIDEGFKNTFLLNFLNSLENNPDVKNVYDTMGFVDELKSLEDQSQNLNTDVNFLRFYQSLSDRISDFAKEKGTDKKVLAYLYTATLGRIHNLEDDLESSLIGDITSYLESVKHDIEKLKDLRNGKFKEDMTNKYKQSYKSEIDKKIKDAEDLITKEIKPAIQTTEDEIDKQIENLINEVISLKNQSTVQSGELAKKEKQLERALVIEAVFSSLKIIGQVASLAGPVGAVAGSAIGIGTSLAESFQVDVSSDSEIELPDLEEDLEGLKDEIEELTEKKANDLKNTLESASEEIKKNPKELKGLSGKVSAIKSKFEGMVKKKLNIKDVQGLETELKTTIEAEKIKMTKDRKISVATAIDKFQKATQLASVVAESFNKYQKSKGKLDEIRKAIEKNEETFDNLKKYEDKIYSTMVPMLENMKDNLDDTISQMKTKGKVDLQVTKWKVKTTLKDLMSKMEQATKAFNVSGSLKRCIEKLQDAMVTLINVQEYIQDYQKDQTLSEFIAGVSSTTVSDFDVSHNLTVDSGLRDALLDLEITITSSIVIQRYKVAINAFKQFVFPFAHIYLKGLMRPSHFKTDNKQGNKLENIVSTAILNIEHIQSKLQEYKMSINKYDACTGTGEFKGKFRPFFVWRDRDIISKLLSGKEVVLKANVKGSPSRFDAIKFNHVVFYFKPKPNPKPNSKPNPNQIQKQINKELRKFYIKTTHLGDSHFRYGHNIYVMPTADVSFWYTFKLNSRKEAGQASASYNKLSKGDFMLSPYATWKIQLKKNAEKYSFKDLEKFHNTVNLALGGIGHYVLKDDCPELKVDNYYNAINVHNAVDSIAELNADDSVTLFDDPLPLLDDPLPLFDDPLPLFDDSVHLLDAYSFF